MMQDPDPFLSPLATIRPPRGLSTLEQNVFAAIETRGREVAAARRAGLLSVGAALAFGLVGGGVIAGAATPAQASTPIGIDGALAPSTLLLGR